MKKDRRSLFVHIQKGLFRIKLFRKHPWILYPLFFFAAFFMVSGLVITILSRNLPSLTTLEHYDPQLVTRIYSSDGKVLQELYMENRDQVPIDRMPETLIQATIATEDRRFFRHWGIDLMGIARAAVVNMASLRIKQGAGTLTGQLARKLYLTPEKKWSRKIREALTVLQIERTYSKSEILEMYLNHMFFENRAYGVQAAAKRYFGKNVEELKIEESALLVGILRRPGRYNPYKYPDAALQRRNLVLRNMEKYGYLARAEADSLVRLAMKLSPAEEKSNSIAPYFCEYVRRQMEEKYGIRLVTDGLSIYTTLDTRIQTCAEKAVNDKIPQLEKQVRRRILNKHEYAKWMGMEKYSPEANALLSDTTRLDSLMAAKATLQVAMVSMDPSNGNILAMIGGRDFEKSKFNRAVQAKRQPGSAFKPFIYTAAIDNGYPPDYELLNQPVVLTMVDGSRWSPPNYDKSTGGLTTLRRGLMLSLNLVTVRLIQEVVPPQKVVNYAKQFGLTTEIMPYDAIALGVFEVIPLELVSAFCVWDNGGVWNKPVSILRVEDKDGNVLEESAPERREVISQATAFIMTSMLRDVVDHGTGYDTRRAYGFKRPAAGKTGTTNDFTDAWFVGFTPQIAAGVWVGFDDKRISLGEDQSGAVAALPIWAPFMRMVYDSLELPEADFRMPPDVVRLNVCSESKKIATVTCPKIWSEVFRRDQAPADTCDIHGRPTMRNTREKVIF
jgi:penicillin-binding protein 1A